MEAGKTATLNVSDTPKVTDTLIELFKIDMETQKDAPQGDASLEGAEFTWKFYAGHYTADNLPSEPTKTWVTKTIAEKDSDGTIHYVSRLSDEYKVSGDSFYTQDGKNVLPLGTLTVEEMKIEIEYTFNASSLGGQNLVTFEELYDLSNEDEPVKVERSVSSMSRKSNSSILRLPPRERTCEVVVTPTIS